MEYATTSFEPEGLMFKRSCEGGGPFVMRSSRLLACPISPDSLQSAWLTSLLHLIPCSWILSDLLDFLESPSNRL